MMSVYDVTSSVTSTILLRVSLPEKRLFALLIQWNVWIDCGVNKYAMAIDVHEIEVSDPFEMRVRNNAWIRSLARVLTVRNESLIAPVPNPPVQLCETIAGLPHHCFVVALQTNQPDLVISPIHEALDNFATIRPTINVIAQSYNR